MLFSSGLRFPNMLFAGWEKPTPDDIVGSFGASLVTSYDADLDFVKGEWRVLPDTKPDFTGLRQVASRFTGDPQSGERILVDASIDGFSGEFAINIGWGGMASLDSRATARSGLWEADRPYAPAPARGNLPSRIIRAGTLRVGPLTLHRSLLSIQKPGNPSQSGDGSIGMGVLQRLHLTTQVKSRTLWIAPNGRPARPDRYPMSGLWLDRKGDAITIADVGTGSPAAAAGLKIGEGVTGAGWDDLTKRLGGPAGSEVALDVGTRRVVLKLADYL